MNEQYAGAEAKSFKPSIPIPAQALPGKYVFVTRIVNSAGKSLYSAMNASSATTITVEAPAPTAVPTQVPVPAISDSNPSAGTSKQSFGIRNYEQIMISMSLMTGFDYRQPSIQKTYSEVSSSLPNTNDINEFSASTQVAIVKLAAEFCHEAVESPQLRSVIWPNFNFDLRPNQDVFSQANKDLLVQGMINRFWGGQELNSTELNKAKTRLSALLNDLLAGERTDTNVTTKNVGKALCTTALSSAYVTLL